MVVQLNDAPKPSIHHCTMVLRGSTGAPIWHQYHKLLGQQSQLFQVRKYLINHMMRYTHRNECLPHDKLNGTVNFINCQSAWNQYFGGFHGRVEVFEEYFIQFNLTRIRNSFLCVQRQSMLIHTIFRL